MTRGHKGSRANYRQSYMPKYEAGLAVTYEKLKKRLKPASAYLCQNCHKPASGYHHPSYRPDDRLCVVALCTKCHIRHHKSGLRLPPLGTAPTAVGIIRISIASA